MPKTRGRPVPLTPMNQMTRVGFEPDLTSLKDWQPHQKSNGPCARTVSVSGRAEFLEAGWKALESFSPGFQPGAKPSQLPSPYNEKTRCLSHDTGL